jgi:flagellar P-ring protein precursor FlgI
MQLKNVAAVMVVTAVLPPPFVRPGQNIDITVSVHGNATDCAAAPCRLTPLKVPTGHIPQGNMAIGGGRVVGGARSASINRRPVDQRAPSSSELWNFGGDGTC